MKKIIYKLFWAWNFDKEEKWLNLMAEKGLILTSVGWGRYVFEENKDNKYKIRLELLDNVPCSEESQRYIDFIQETGAEYVGSVMRWVYFKKKTADGSFDLYSDCASRIKQLNRILYLLVPLFFINIINGLYNITTFIKTNISFNMVIGVIAMLIGSLIGYGAIKISAKKKKFKLKATCLNNKK